MKLNTTSVTITAVLGIIALLAGCGSAYKELEQTDADTAAIVIAIKNRLIESSEVDAAAIRINLDEDGRILLRGFVESVKESEIAEEITREVNPDLQLINSLVVK